MAKVTIAFDSWKDGRVTSSQHEIAVVAAHSLNLKLEAVSSRLKGELIHPNKTSTIANIEFSADGKRILAGDYPGGVVALWDVAGGKRLTTIETGYGQRALQYYAVSPDWQTVFAHREKRQVERVNQDGKQMIRWTFGGDVRAWNLEDGKLLRTYKRQPQSNVAIMRLAPDGKSFYTFDELPGVTEGRAKLAVSLWDVKTGSYRTLEGQQRGVFSADGSCLALVAQDEGNHSYEMKMIDVSTGRRKWSLPISGKYVRRIVSMFSRDGGMLFGADATTEHPKQSDKLRCQLKWWDAATGREVASLACEQNEAAHFVALSPDGQIAVARDSVLRRSKRTLSLYSVAQKRLLRTVVLGDKTAEQLFLRSSPVFSPDGKWIAVIVQSFPERPSVRDLDPRDIPQPRIVLIETATGAIRETIISPQAFAVAACFSPDGRTLATGGNGRVHLWDMRKMPQ